MPLTDHQQPDPDPSPGQGQVRRASHPGASVGATSKADTGLLACIGPWPESDQVVRSAANLASQLDAEWHAIYVETAHLQRLPPARRERILNTLKLAQDLGATTAVLAGNDIAREIVDYARTHHFSRIVLGRDHSRWPWQTPHLKRIAACAPHIDLIETGRREAEAPQESVASDGAPAAAADAEALLSGRPKH